MTELFQDDEFVKCPCGFWFNLRKRNTCPRCHRDKKNKNIDKIFKELQKEFGVKRS